MTEDESDSTTQATARRSGSAVDGSAMSRLFARGSDSEDDAGDFDDVALALARAYCFSMDSGMGAVRDALLASAGVPKRDPDH